MGNNETLNCFPFLQSCFLLFSILPFVFNPALCFQSCPLFSILPFVFNPALCFQSCPLFSILPFVFTPALCFQSCPLFSLLPFLSVYIFLSVCLSSCLYVSVPIFRKVFNFPKNFVCHNINIFT